MQSCSSCTAKSLEAPFFSAWRSSALGFYLSIRTESRYQCRLLILFPSFVLFFRFLRHSSVIPGDWDCQRYRQWLCDSGMNDHRPLTAGGSGRGVGRLPKVRWTRADTTVHPVRYLCSHPVQTSCGVSGMKERRRLIDTWSSGFRRPACHLMRKTALLARIHKPNTRGINI